MACGDYLKLFERGLLLERALLLEDSLSACNLCPRRFGVNRNQGTFGACGVDSRPKVAAISIHPWEDPPVSGAGGSGTIISTRLLPLWLSGMATRSRHFPYFLPV